MEEIETVKNSQLSVEKVSGSEVSVLSIDVS